MAFSDHLAGLDDAVVAHLSDGVGRVVPFSGGQVIESVHPLLERATDVDQLEGAGILRTKPTMQIAVAEVAQLAKSDVVELDGRRWKIVAAPARPGDGRWWVADVQDVGPVA